MINYQAEYQKAQRKLEESMAINRGLIIRIKNLEMVVDRVARHGKDYQISEIDCQYAQTLMAGSHQ